MRAGFEGGFTGKKTSEPNAEDERCGSFIQVFDEGYNHSAQKNPQQSGKVFFMSVYNILLILNRMKSLVFFFWHFHERSIHFYPRLRNILTKPVTQLRQCLEHQPSTTHKFNPGSFLARPLYSLEHIYSLRLSTTKQNQKQPYLGHLYVANSNEKRLSSFETQTS